MTYETILCVDDPSVARALITALKAYGFNPLEGGESGVPGLPGIMGPRGIGIQVPENEVRDATPLAEELLSTMKSE